MTTPESNPGSRSGQAPNRTVQPWVRRMVARDATTPHRASTNLELLFDLTFVVAVATVARELAHSLEAGHYGHAIGGYAMVFFAIWWAWMNFTWFASAYDTDDVPYRLLTLVQMGGVLVLAAGIPSAFEHNEFAGVTVGYVIMRIALVVQWLRAAAADASHRRTCLRYAVGISVVQVGWLVRLVLPDDLAVPSFIVLAICEVLVPILAERGNMTTWHPEHIGERYGLFTIIILGECVTQVANAIQSAYDEGGLSGDLVASAIAGLVLLFGLWWLYFIVPQGERLRVQRNLAFVWGYGHLIVFASLAAVAAGLEVAIASISDHGELSTMALAFIIAIPLAVFLVIDGVLCALLTEHGEPPIGAVAVAGALCLLAALTGAWWPIPVVATLVILPVVLLVGYSVVVAHWRSAAAGRTQLSLAALD
jgi:low temperature requirement protein LtrA